MCDNLLLSVFEMTIWTASGYPAFFLDYTMELEKGYDNNQFEYRQ